MPIQIDIYGLNVLSESRTQFAVRVGPSITFLSFEANKPTTFLIKSKMFGIKNFIGNCP